MTSRAAGEGGSSLVSTALTLLVGAAIAATVLGAATWQQQKAAQKTAHKGENGLHNGLENVDGEADERLASAKKKKKGKRKVYISIDYIR